MSKKLIVIVGAFGLASFAGAFGVAWLTKADATSRNAEPNTPQTAQNEFEPSVPEPQIQTGRVDNATDQNTKRAMTERQLKGLIAEVREKIRQYDEKLKELETREKRLQVARDTLKNDIEELTNLQVQLASTIAGLKEQNDILTKNRVVIAQAEKANLISIAAAYDKMEASSASKIIASISQTPGTSADDAIKILHYMTDRTKAKLLAELSASEPKLAANFSLRLKRVAENK